MIYAYNNIAINFSLHNAYCLMADKYIPYTVMVRASTSAGYGPPASDITFTEEGSKSLNNMNLLACIYNLTFQFRMFLPKMLELHGSMSPT